MSKCYCAPKSTHFFRKPEGGKERERRKQTRERGKKKPQATADTRRQRVKQDPLVFSCIFCFWQMKNVNCPVCICEFLHYSSASLVPAAPSPWQLPAPCSQCVHTHTHTSLKIHTHTQIHTYWKMHDCSFLQPVSLQRFRWLTHSLTSEASVYVCRSVCVCVPLCWQMCVCACVWFIDIRERDTAHACLLSVWGVRAAGGRTHAHAHTCTHVFTPALVRSHFNLMHHK